MLRRRPPRKVTYFRTGPAAPRAQHDHRVDLRGRPPLPLHDARRLWRTRSRRVSGRYPATAPPYAERRRGACRLARWTGCSLSARRTDNRARASRSSTHRRPPGLSERRRVFLHRGRGSGMEPVSGRRRAPSANMVNFNHVILRIIWRVILNSNWPQRAPAMSGRVTAAPVQAPRCEQAETHRI